MKGRKPKTEKELKANGTYQPVYHANRLQAEPIVELPPPPAYFDKEHKAKYQEVGRLMLRQGVLSDSDVDVLIMYVETDLTRSRAYTRFLKNGERHDWLIFRDALTLQKRIQDDIGFNPRARMAMKVEKPKEEKTDPVAELLKSLGN